MQNIKQYNFSRIAIHFSFWLASFLFFLFYYKRYSEINPYTIFASVFHVIIGISTVYSFNYYLIPKHLLKAEYVKFTFLSIAALILFIYAQILITMVLLIKLLYTEQTLFPKTIDALVLIVNLLFIVIIGVSIKLFKRWVLKEKQEQELQKEKVEAELKMLKTQINPHFLFNTLNSIYVLAMKNSHNTANTVLKLSDILDFILYKNNADQVLLTDELNIAKNYIELGKIRFGERANVHITEKINNKEFKIPPMVIIPLIENAFKHGVSKSMEPSWVNISIVELNNTLKVDISNSKKDHNDEKTISKGIGLANVKQRLKLIYGENYEFTVSEKSNTFEVKLIIKQNPDD